MSKQLHLYAGLFRIHRFHGKAFGLYDLNLVLGIGFLVYEQLGEGLSRLFFVDQFVFVFTKLAFDDLLNQVDGYIHIIAGFLGADNAAFYRNRNFDLLFIFLYTECYDDLCIWKEIPFQLPNLFFYSGTKPRSHINISACNCITHKSSAPLFEISSV